MLAAGSGAWPQDTLTLVIAEAAQPMLLSFLLPLLRVPTRIRTATEHDLPAACTSSCHIQKVADTTRRGKRIH